MRLWVVETDSIGGMTHYAYQLCSAMSAAGADVTLISTPHYELKDLPHDFSVRPVMRLWPNVEHGPRPGPVRRRVRRAARAVRLIREWVRLTRLVRRERPDIVQFGAIRFPFQAVFLRAMRRSGVRLTQVCHEFEERDLTGWIRAIERRMSAAVYPSFDVIFLHGESHRNRFHRFFTIDRTRTHSIPHGDEDLFTVVDRGGDLTSRYGAAAGSTVLFFGGLRPSKGVEDLVEAIAIARDEIEVRLLVVGKPDGGFDLPGLRRRITELGLEDAVTIDDRYLAMEDVGPLMRTTDVVALPYRSAAASGVHQVATSFAVPTVVTAVGNLPEAVDHGSTGLVVPASSPPDLARAIVKLLADPDEARAMGSRARERARAIHGWDTVAGAMLAVYGRLDP